MITSHGREQTGSVGGAGRGVTSAADKPCRLHARASAGGTTGEVLAAAAGASNAAIARTLGVSVNTVRKWRTTKLSGATGEDLGARRGIVGEVERYGVTVVNGVGASGVEGRKLCRPRQ
ncbi:helix-turn-helix domain-containing protein [Streptomyces sp. NPDC088353]|uniref:helix-turn-helix domain-containing protein n=1 Tax=unclassified Streptomyces TaxID=2593676 RepID=UPI0036B65382